MKNMKEIFKELILDFHAGQLPIGIKRDIQFPNLPLNVRKVFVLIGMRRSGKTWTLYQMMQELITEGVDKTKMLYLNFEDERLVDMQKDNFQEIIKAYFELYPQYINQNDIYFFFDEIHEIDGWEKFIRRILEQEKMQIYVTGSSSKMLSKEIASSLRGRTYVKEVFPFNFKEYLEKLDVQLPKILGTKSKIELYYHLKNYLVWGGFPEVIGTSDEIHRNLLQEYSSSVIYRDIVDRYNISNSHLLRQLLTHCLKNSARIFSVIKMFNMFKSLGYEVSKNTLYDYMSYFEDAYCIFSIQKYDLSFRKSSNSMKKIFAIDPGLITSVSVASNFDLSMQLETAIFMHLRRQSNMIYYYKTIDDKEVDFVVINSDQTMQLIQVCISLNDSKTKKREVDALIVAMQELNIKTGKIVTLEESEEILTDFGTITVEPLLKFYLDK